VIDPQEGLLRSLRALPRSVWWLFAGSFVNRFGSFVSVFLILYLVDRGYSAPAAGSVAAAYGVGGLGAAVIGGYLADRIGRRRAIALSMFSSAVTVLALSRVDGLAALWVLTALFGLTSDLYRPASAALLTDLVPSERRLVAFAGYRLAINAGFAVGPAVAGFLAERSFVWLFVGEAVTSVVLGVVALVALPEGVRTSRREETRGAGLRAVAADRSFVTFLFAVVLSGFVYWQSGAAFPLHVLDSGLSTAVYGLLIGLNATIIVVLELPLMRLVRRFPAPRVIALGVLITGIGFALTAPAHAVLPLALTVVVWTFGEMAAAPTSSAYVAELAPVRLRGRYQGAYGSTFAISHILAPVVGTSLYAWSPDGIWLICGAVSVVAAALIVRLPGGPIRRPHVEPPDVGPEVPGADR
jgi:MFS family permease